MFHSGALGQFVKDGIRFFENLDRNVPLHLREVKACRNGMVGLRYEVRG
jgi:hypothetical protein